MTSAASETKVSSQRYAKKEIANIKGAHIYVREDYDITWIFFAHVEKLKRQLAKIATFLTTLNQQQKTSQINNMFWSNCI